MPARTKSPTELQEQIALVRWLRARGVCFAHPPNGGRRSRRTGAALRAAGMSAGLPDLLVFDRPPLCPDRFGVAIELKRVRPTGRPSQVTERQRNWLAALEARGWVATVAFGARDAIEQLEALGF